MNKADRDLVKGLIEYLHLIINGIEGLVESLQERIDNIEEHFEGSQMADNLNEEIEGLEDATTVIEDLIADLEEVGS